MIHRACELCKSILCIILEIKNLDNAVDNSIFHAQPPVNSNPL